MTIKKTLILTLVLCFFISLGNFSSVSANSSPISNGNYFIQATSGKVLDVRNRGIDNGEIVHLWDKNDGPNQIFRLERLSDNTYRITPTHSNKSLEVRDSSRLDGAPIAQWDWHDAYACKRWYIIDTGGGWYKFVNKESGKCLDVQNGLLNNNGTILQQYSDNGTASQRFRLISAVSNTGVKPPTPTISVNKTTFSTGETVTLNFNYQNATGVALGIDHDNNNGSWYRFDTPGVTGRTSYSRSFDKPGTYAVYVSAANNYGYSDSQKVTFKVTSPIHPPTTTIILNTKPPTPTISVNKTTFSTGETVTLNFSYQNATGAALGIDHDNNNGSWYRLATPSVTGKTSYLANFSKPGNYAVYISVSNPYGYADSQKVTFRVNPVSYNEWTGRMTSSRTNVYSQPEGGSQVGWVDNVDPVIVKGESGSYYLIQYKTSAGAYKTGYVPKSSVTKIDDDTGYAKPIQGNGKFQDKTWEGFHHDFIIGVGTPLYAICDGIAYYKIAYRTDNNGKYYSSYGKWIEFVGNDGKTKARYAHLSKFAGVDYTEIPLARTKKESGSTGSVNFRNVSYKKGDIIGYTGNTGNSSAPHLHFELFINGKRVDPCSYVNIPH